MRRTENHHDDRSRKVFQPDGGAQKVQHREHRQRHRDKEKRTAQKRNLPSAHKIAEPHGVVQNQENCRKGKPDAPEAESFPAHKQRNRKQIGDAADLFDDLNPMCDRCGLFRFSGRQKHDIGDVDQHGQRKDHKPDPRKGHLQIHKTTPAFTANSGSFAGFP